MFEELRRHMGEDTDATERRHAAMAERIQTLRDDIAEDAFWVVSASLHTIYGEMPGDPDGYGARARAQAAEVEARLPERRALLARLEDEYRLETGRDVHGDNVVPWKKEDVPVRHADDDEAIAS